MPLPTIPAWDLRCEKCRLIEPRPAPALSVPEAAALLRSHRCDATPREVWVQPVDGNKNREIRTRLFRSLLVWRSPGGRAS